MIVRKNGEEGGFSLLEIMFALTILTLILVTMGLGIHSSALVAREIQRDLLIQTKAQAFVDTALAVHAGNSLDADPTGEQLDEVFDEDPIVGNITLHQLTRWPIDDDGWKFTLTNFPVDGEWRVKVDNDLDDDGLIGGGPVDTDDQVAIQNLENSKQVFHIRVFFNDDLILATNRSLEVSL